MRSPCYSPPPLQPSFTFSYYGRVGTQPLRNRRLNPGLHRPVTLSRSLNDLSTLRPPAQRRELQRSASSLSSETLASEGEGEGGTTVRLLWLSMLKVKQEGSGGCSALGEAAGVRRLL